MQLNDPRLTAFILGELNAEDAKAVKDASLTNKAIANELATIEETINLVSEGYQTSDIKLTASQRSMIYAAGSDPKIEDISSSKSRSMKVTWISASIGAAAAVALLMVFGRTNGSSGDSIDFSSFPASQLAERVGVAQWPWDHGSENMAVLEISPLEKALSSSPAKFRTALREEVKSDLNIVPTSDSSFASKWLHPIHQSSTTLPLTSSSLSWQWIHQTEQSGAALITKFIRAEELMNAVKLPIFEHFALDGVTASLDYSPCPWNKNALLAVIHIQNTEKMAIAEVSAGISLNLQASQFRLIGYDSAETSSLDSTAQATLDAQYHQTVVYELDFNELPAEDSPLVTLHLRVKNEQRSMKFNFDPIQTHSLSPASVFAIASSHWAKLIQEGESTENERAELKLKLSALQDSSSSTEAAKIYKTLSTFL